MEGLGKLKPVFKPDGTVTAGNASGMNDAGAAVVLMSAQKAEELGAPVRARILSYSYCGVDPRIMGIGPVPAVRKAMERAGRSLDDVDVIELNEAFAAQSLAVMKDLDLDPEKVNPNGGAIALGHPIAATGAVITAKILYEMERKGQDLGLVTLCIGGGQGIAMLLSRRARDTLVTIGTRRSRCQSSKTTRRSTSTSGSCSRTSPDDPELSPKFRRADTIVQYRYINPDSQITVKMKDGEDGQVDFGPTRNAARDRDVHGGRHRAQVLARQGERHDGAGEGPDEGEGPGREDPQARAAREAGLPALPEDARGARTATTC